MRKLVLWGHHVNEYQEMFDLSAAEVGQRLIEYGSGPSAVNAELMKLGHTVLSYDPWFALDKPALSALVDSVFADMAARVIKEQDKFDFSSYGSPEALIAQRRKGIAEFFADYERGKEEGRYRAPLDHRLPLADFSFDYALSSHYLFADLDDQDVAFHLQVIKELARVAKEVRIFPLIDRNGHPSPFLGPVLLGLQQDNYGAEVREVNYHLQNTNNAMLRVWAQQCDVGSHLA